MVNSKLRKAFQYNKICASKQVLNARFVELQKHKIGMEVIETVVERMPQTILQLSFLLAGLQYPRLLILLKDNLQNILNIESVSLIFILVFGTTFWSITKSLIDLK